MEPIVVLAGDDGTVAGLKPNQSLLQDVSEIFHGGPLSRSNRCPQVFLSQRPKVSLPILWDFLPTRSNPKQQPLDTYTDQEPNTFQQTTNNDCGVWCTGTKAVENWWKQINPSDSAQAAPEQNPLQAEPDGRIDPQKVYEAALKKVENSELNGRVPEASLRKLGVNGSPESWAKLFTQLQQQESGNRIADVNSDGSLKKFSTTPDGEQSYGPGQFNKGEYGLKTWADVNNPDKVLDAYIQVAEQGKMGAYFGSVQQPQEITKWNGWFDNNVSDTGGNYDPFTQRGDFSKFTFDTALQNQSFPEPQMVSSLQSQYAYDLYGESIGNYDIADASLQNYYNEQAILAYNPTA